MSKMRKKLHFYGPVETASGYGVHARQLLRSLIESDQFDISVESIGWGSTPYLSGTDTEWFRHLIQNCSNLNFDVSVQVSIPNEFKRRAPITIGVTAGIEVDRVSPSWIIKVNSEVDHLVVPSNHSRDTFMIEYGDTQGNHLRLQKVPVVIHEGFDPDVYRPNTPARQSVIIDRLIQEALASGFKFSPDLKMLCFTGLGLDQMNGEDRKNISGLITNFYRAFAGRNDVALVLKTSIVGNSLLDFQATMSRIAAIRKNHSGEVPPVLLVHGRLSDQQLSEIYNDPRMVAHVSLTHGEGFGLPLLEAAACGLPIIATNWSGHRDFLIHDGKPFFLPIDFTMAEIPKSRIWNGVMEQGSLWANPNADHAIRLMRMAVDEPCFRTRFSDLTPLLQEKFALAAVGKQFVDFIGRACSSGQEIHREISSESKNSSKKNGGDHRSVRFNPEFIRFQRNRSVIYTMPISRGDVFLSRFVLLSLREKIGTSKRLFFATAPENFDIVQDLVGSCIDELIEWEPWMMNVGSLEEIFSEVYTPNLDVQLTTSNWIRGGTGRHLLEMFFDHCGLQVPKLEICGLPHEQRDDVVVIHAGGQKSARRWDGWADLVHNLSQNGLRVIQVGAKDDINVGPVHMDLRGKLNHHMLVQTIREAKFFIGIDSYPMHVASFNCERVYSIFGSSYPSKTGPFTQIKTDRNQGKTFESLNRRGCERACYKDQCKVSQSDPCINDVKASDVFHSLFPETKFIENRPKIGGYTHILNPLSAGYPFIDSILSMTRFCFEVIVIDGGSEDGSLEKLESALTEYGVRGIVKIIHSPWDPDEPAMDGKQKARGRNAISREMEFCWQQDADEIVHPSDVNKIWRLCRLFPEGVDMLHLPIIELWGDDRTCRTDRHAWKWRLFRNKARITHGINRHAKVPCEDGKFRAKIGMSDGCEFIDMFSEEMISHHGFYSQELERLRKSDPKLYGDQMNMIFSELPSVWHYSWADLERKIRNFNSFWDRQWFHLYGEGPKQRFPGVRTDDQIREMARVLKDRGGEHGPAVTFKLNREPPKLIS